MHKRTHRSALIFGHADGDGYLAAYQSKLNLENDGYEILDVIADPSITKGWKFWHESFQTMDFGNADFVVVVDVMLKPKHPLLSWEMIATRARQEPHRSFLIIDHHPMPLDVPAIDNLEIRFVESVYECCYGQPSDLMLIASICDKDEGPVKERLTDWHRLIARGINRAVSDRQGLAGKPLLHLLGAGCWDVFEILAAEPAKRHKTMYGNRVKSNDNSPLLQVARACRAYAG